MDLVENVYELTGTFPKSEVYGLASQMQRAAVSIPSNVAEGYTRRHRREYVQHLTIAEASLAELDTQLEIASRLGHLSKREVEPVLETISSLGRQIYSLRRSLSAKRPRDIEGTGLTP